MTSKFFVGALIGALMFAASLWSYPASALTFHYSFGPIEGFISGLNDDATSPAASVTVTVSTIGGLGEYAPGDPNIFTVSFGTITAAQFDSLVGTFELILTTSDGVLVDHGTQNSLHGAISYSATTPLPAALPLFATGLGALGLLGWRRKRRALAD